MKVEIETTIRNGLPVMARGRYTPGADYIPEPGGGMGVICPGWSEGVEDIEIFWRKMPRKARHHWGPQFGKAIPERLITDDDEDRIIEQMVATVRENGEDWR